MIFQHLTQAAQAFKQALQKTKSALVSKIRTLFQGPIDSESLEKLEAILLEADLGQDVVKPLIESVKKELDLNRSISFESLIPLLKTQLLELVPEDKPLEFQTSPHVILIVGVNGSGKTTSIAKLSNYFKKQGHSVMVAAADTFRAAAIDQISLWCERVGVPCIKGKPGGDPSAVLFDALTSAKAKGASIVLVDTAGRLENKAHLMQELEKMTRTAKKILPSAPHDIWLVIDGTTGQTALSQALSFHAHTPLSGLIITKLDGTAKGGVAIAIRKKLKTPIRFIGTGEGVDDFTPFNRSLFVDSFFE